jgi:hypothetical protein
MAEPEDVEDDLFADLYGAYFYRNPISQDLA